MTAKPVPEHISDERLDKVIARLTFEFDGVRTNTAKDILLVLTELQHRREAGLAIDQSAMKAAALAFYGEHGVTAMSGAIPPQFERAIIAYAAASPASGVRVKVKPLEWHGPDFEDEYWAASLDLKYVIHPPNERGVRWLGGVGGYFRLVDEAKAVAEKHNEARILSALGEHP